jgi:nitrous oxidase accessory protein
VRPWAIFAALASACGPAKALAPPRAAAAELARPFSCREVSPDEDLAALLAAAVDGDSLCLAPGRHRGPLRVERRVTLFGPREAVVAGADQGTTIRVRAMGAVLAGFTVDGAGTRYDLLDAAVAIEADGVRVEGLAIRGAIYGILASRVRGVSIRRNFVQGDAKETLGLRGDAIRLWEVTDSEVAENDVEDGRDVVVWYSSRNRLVGNRVAGGRYGAHLMYSHDTLVQGNQLVGDVVGVFVMYSRGVRVEDNLIAEMHGAAGMGLGLKDSGNVTATGNRVVRATTGLFLDASPSQLGDHNEFRGNRLHWCGQAVTLHSAAERNLFADNLFSGNRALVVVDGGGHARGAEWRGNYWDEYAGYDLDGDGRGDVPFELRSLTEEITRDHPALGFFTGSPAFALVAASSRLVPLRAPVLLLRDPAPRMEAW